MYSGDPVQAMNLRFNTKEDAIRFAQRQGNYRLFAAFLFFWLQLHVKAGNIVLTILTSQQRSLCHTPITSNTHQAPWDLSRPSDDCKLQVWLPGSQGVCLLYVFPTIKRTSWTLIYFDCATLQRNAWMKLYARLWHALLVQCEKGSFSFRAKESPKMLWRFV
jgi:hypothetical protein